MFALRHRSVHTPSSLSLTIGLTSTFCFEQILLVTSNRYPDKWIVPAGGVEAGERFQDAAVREVFEEVSRLC